jgi:8-oxo-dGTP pyrophosphatase MutT (NUDIX family)
VQYGALPWRNACGSIEILLITTRNTKRWIVPKGWPIGGLSPRECAACEALEEAGVDGEVAEQALGSFRYDKRRKSGDLIPCTVHLFAIEVFHQHENWPEKAARERYWCSVADAVARVAEPTLQHLISNFGSAANRLPVPAQMKAPRL